jgi:hypothetical protein
LLGDVSDPRKSLIARLLDDLEIADLDAGYGEVRDLELDGDWDSDGGFVWEGLKERDEEKWRAKGRNEESEDELEETMRWKDAWKVWKARTWIQGHGRREKWAEEPERKTYLSWPMEVQSALASGSPFLLQAVWSSRRTQTFRERSGPNQPTSDRDNERRKSLSVFHERRKRGVWSEEQDGAEWWRYWGGGKTDSELGGIGVVRYGHKDLDVVGRRSSLELSSDFDDVLHSRSSMVLHGSYMGQAA